MVSMLKPKGKVKITRIFINKRNGQMSIILPKKKMKRLKDKPVRVEVTYW